VLSLLTIGGVLQRTDAATLQDALSKCVTAIFVLLANSWVVVRYIQSRTRLKESAARTPGVLPFVVLPWLLLALAGMMPSTAAAPPPPRKPHVSTCLGLYRQAPRDDTLVLLMQQMIGLQQSLANQQMILSLLHQRQATPPAQPMVIHYYHPQPLQQLPIAGAP